MQTVNKQGRLQWVDYARGIAIMLVVYRHVVIGVRTTGFEISSFMYDAQEVFFNFRMPVFFVLSGIFIAGSLVRKSLSAVLKDRTSTLLYMYLLWGGVTIVLLILFSRFANYTRTWANLVDLIAQPREVGHLWYLLALFNASALYLLLTRIKMPDVLHILLAATMYLLSQLKALHHISVVSDLFYYYPFFLMGTYVSPVILDREKGPKVLHTKNLLWLVPLFLAGQTFWFLHREEKSELYLVPFFIINSIACYFIYVLSNLLSKYKSNFWLAYLGSYSLYIYILHVYIASMTRTVLVHLLPSINVWVLVFTCWAVGLIVPVLLYNLLKGVGMEKLFSLKTKSVA